MNPKLLPEHVSPSTVDQKPFIEAYVRTMDNGERYLGFETRLELGIKPDQDECNEMAFFAMRYSRAFLDFAISDGREPSVRRYRHQQTTNKE